MALKVSDPIQFLGNRVKGNLDDRYGPYNFDTNINTTLQNIINSLKTGLANLLSKGLKVGIIIDNKIVEYTFQGDPSNPTISDFEHIINPKDLEYSDGTSFLNNGKISADYLKLAEIDGSEEKTIEDDFNVKTDTLRIDGTTYGSSKKEEIRATIGAQENITSMADKLPVVAALNDRAADTVLGTGEVRALGYKVLNPTLSFVDQVTAENTVYEIKDEFNLDGGSVTIPANCTLKFNGGSVKNGTINGTATLIVATEAFDETITFTGSFQNDTISSSIFKKTIIDFTYVVGSLMTIVKDSGKIVIERNLTAIDITVVNYCLKINRDLYIDFQNYTITLAERPSTTSTTGYLFYSKPTNPCKVRIENVVINATANIEQTGQFSGMTSWWSLCYLQNNIDVLIQNVKFHNAANVIRCAAATYQHIEKNITIKNCDLHGKMLVQIYTCSNVKIEQCTFDGSLATNNYDHALYVTDTTNFKAENNVFKNYRDAVNVYNSNTSATLGDEKSIYFIGSKVENCGRFMAMNKTINAVIENTYITGVSGKSTAAIWINNSLGVKVTNFYLKDNSFTVASGNYYYPIYVSSSTNISIERAYIELKTFTLYLSDSTQVAISDSSFIASEYIPSSTRAYISSSDVIINNCTFDFGGVNAMSEPIRTTSGKNIFNNCIFKDLKTTAHLLCNYTNGENVELHNCQLTNIYPYYSDADYSYPTVDNCTRNGSLIADFPARKSGTSTWRNKTIVTDRLVAGFTYFDTTINRLIVWTGSMWVDSNGEPIGLNVSDTSVLIADSPKTVSVYYGGTTAPTITVLNSDDSANTWLTATPDPFTGNTLTLTAAANNTSAPRGAKVLVSLGDELVIINVVQSY